MAKNIYMKLLVLTLFLSAAMQIEAKCDWYKMSPTWTYTVNGGTIAASNNLAKYPCVQSFWSLAGATAIKGNNITYKVTKNGIYKLCMKLYDTCNRCDTIICKEIKVDGIKSCNVDFMAEITKDGVKFKPMFACNGKAVYSWKFGNGTFSNNADPFVKFAKGTYEVCLTAKCYTYDQINKRYDSCEAKICKKIVVKANPCELKGDFYFKVGDKNMITFVGYANEQNLLYYWTIDNVERKGRDFSLYLTPGTHKVCMTIYNPKTGCKTTVCKTIEIPQPKLECKVDFTAEITKDGVKFKPNFPCNGTATYFWKFGNGTFSSNFDPFVKYAKGTYEVCLYAKCKVYNKDKKAYDSCETKICKPIVIKENPCDLKGEFSFKIGANNLVTFIATANEQNLLYEWTIDGTTTKKGRDFNMTLSPGTHKVCVTIYNPKTNCKITICKTVIIETPCKIEGFFKDSIVCNRLFLFGGSSFKGNVGFYYTINGEKQSIIKQGQNAVFESALPSGTYTVCLYVLGYTNNNEPSCRDTICKTFTLKACNTKCTLEGAIKDSIVCNKIYFNALTNSKCSTISYRYTITSNNSVVVKETKDPVFEGPNAGANYYVCLVVTDNCTGCKDTICKYIALKPCCNKQLVAEFSDTLKLGGTVRFVNKSIGGYSYKWLFGDNTSSADKNISHTYANAGSYIVCLVAYDSLKNCTDTFCKTVQVTIKRGSSEAMFITGTTMAQWDLYPNPSSDAVTISGFNFSNGDVIRIKDIAGKTVLEINIEKAVTETTLSLEHLVPGIYTIQCQSLAGNSVQSKLIKQ